jgi:hypothetical protein
MRSPDVHDRAAPEQVPCRLTCREEWSMYFYKVRSRRVATALFLQPKYMGRR